MDEIGTRLDELGRAATSTLVPPGLDDVRQRATRQHRTTTGAAAVLGVVALLATGLTVTTLRSGSGPDVTTPLPSATATPQPTASGAPATIRPQPRRALPTATPSKAHGREDGPPGEGEQHDWIGSESTFGASTAADTATAMWVDYGAAWLAMDHGVLKVDATTLLAVDFIDTGDVLALASTGYASMHAATRLPGGGLGLVTWQGMSGSSAEVRQIVVDAAPGAADTLRGYKSLAAFGEAVYLARTFADRPSELWEVNAANSTARRLATMGAPGTRLLISRVNSDSTSDIWVGGSDGVLRHVHDDGHVTEVRVGDTILDVDAAGAAQVWLTAGADTHELVELNAATEQVVRRIPRDSAVFVSASPEVVWLSTGDDVFEGVLFTKLDTSTGDIISESNLALAGGRYIAASGTALLARSGPRSVVRITTTFNE